jgi:sarcosine oxidase subunit gamma
MFEVAMRQEPVPIAAQVFSGVTLRLAAPAARWSLRMKAPQGLPMAMNTSARFRGGDALHLGPDEWLLILPEGSDAPAVDGQHALTEVSDRNVALLIEGVDAERLVQTGCPLEVSLAAFPVGRATRTIFETVEIVLWRTGDQAFRVEVWRSFGPWLWSALMLAAGDL